ncbi:MAG: ATP-dependent helicase, partial [Nanoarchaeota archaeon]|nr:ATP-dependent helicase [Nanoarchaeota archaeon]
QIKQVSLRMTINQEKQNIISVPGNVLVTANPGTGKTLLLAHKFCSFLESGVIPQDILCLTFTNKAKREMEDRILEIIHEKGLKTDLTKLNIHTFHSFALDALPEGEIVSSNLLRFAIYEYLKEKEVLNYADEYIVETIVPRLENLIRYLKSFGITYDSINVAEVKGFLNDEKFELDDLERFLEHFVKIYEHYETLKSATDMDYADLLLKFLAMPKKPHYKFVLVDELQDVNQIEADIALAVGDQFFVVGDQKQAIFGFQGGSILNFNKFNDSTKKVLSENFRSTDEILQFSKNYFTSNTQESAYIDALANFRNAEGVSGPKPLIFSVSKENSVNAVVTKAVALGKAAIIARTNGQIMDISRELKNRGVEHSTTYFSASDEAKNNIINFLKAVFSDDLQTIRNAMFTPYFPVSLQEAFALAKASLEEIYAKSLAFKDLREKTKNLEDINNLFNDLIMPISIHYGEEYVLASLNLQQACNEALTKLSSKNFEDVILYLKSSDLLANENAFEKDIVVTTVHKAKGKQYDNVIYMPKGTNNSKSFQDYVVEAILASKNVLAEFEGEDIRINFVAFTRAKKALYIYTSKPNEFLNSYCETSEPEVSEEGSESYNEKSKRAYNLFINKQYDEAKSLLENDESWLKEFVKKHFDSLEHTSFSRLTDNPYEYFTNNIIKVQESSTALTIGSEVHEMASKMLLGEKVEMNEYLANVKAMTEEIKQEYPEIVFTERRYTIKLKDLIETADDIDFVAVIDALFKKRMENT